ncbi:MAG TPA: carbohydrate ABC transporter permease [Spirochaetia bacterium]|nr:carbohydrate ABC transporter permease [Spirochaetia bacterium]
MESEPRRRESAADRDQAARPRPAARVVLYVVLCAGALMFVLPFLYMASTSLKTSAEAVTRTSAIPFSPDFWPSVPRWVNYAEAWARASFSLYLRNSLVTALVTAAATLATSSLAAYAFARIRFIGSRLVFSVLLATLIIPESVYLVPNFILVTRAGLFDTLAGLTVPFAANAFSIFLLRQFFTQVPVELTDSARVDGAGHLRSLFSIVLPLSTAPVATLVFLSFLGSWNSLQWPLVVTRTPRWRPITVALTTFTSDAGPQNQLIMAGAMIAIIPVVALYAAAQKQFTEAIARTGIKG